MENEERFESSETILLIMHAHAANIFQLEKRVVSTR